MKKSLKMTIVPLTAVGLLLGGCSNSHSKDDTIIESKAGDVKVNDIMKDIGNDQISKSAFQLILNKVLEKEYHKQVDSNDIDKQVDKQKEMFSSNQQFKDALKQQGLTEEKFKDQIKLQKYQKALLDDTVKISDKKAKKDSVKVSHILIETSKDKSKAKSEAEDIKKQLDNGADFSKLAKEKSDDTQSKDNGGSLGYIPKGLMNESFEKAAFKLKPGQISDVVKSEYGYHIIKADKENDFNKNKSKIKDQIVQQKIQKDPSILTDAYKKLLDKYDVKYEDKDVKKYIENNLLNGDKLKNQLGQSQQQTSQAQQATQTQQ